MTEAPLQKIALKESDGQTPPVSAPLIETKNLSLFYGKSQALKNISFDISERVVTAFIGPSGCGKSTLLRCLNRMNDLIDNVRITGEFLVNGQDINARTTDVIEVRRRIGMVFQ